MTMKRTILVLSLLLCLAFPSSAGMVIGGAADTTPDQFTFTDVSSADCETQYTSNTITVAGIAGTADVTISGGDFSYSKNGGAYTSTTPTTCVNGDTFRVRHTASASNSTAVNTVLTIGGVSDTYTTTTNATTYALLDTSFADLTGWTDSDGATGVSSIDPAGQLSMFGGSTHVSYAVRNRDVGTFSQNITIIIKTYLDSVGTNAYLDVLAIDAAFATDNCFSFSFCSDGLYITTTAGGAWHLVSATTSSSEWQTWRFVINYLTKVVSVYLTDSTHADELVVNAHDFLYSAAGYVNGILYLSQYSYTTNNKQSHIDFIRIKDN